MWHSIAAFFGGSQSEAPIELVHVAGRAALVYVVGVAAVRLGKSRLLGRATPLDVLLGFILGSLLSRGINGSASLASTITATVVLVVIHSLLTAMACRSHIVGNLIKGHSEHLVHDGQILWDNMRHAHISEHDLAEGLRLNANLGDVAAVADAYKERNGEIGVVRRKPSPQVIELGMEQGVKRLRIELPAG